VIAILWDLDGVVADTADAHFAAWQDLMAERGLSVTRPQFEATFGMNNPPILREWLGADVPADEIARLGKHKEVLYRQHLAGNVRMLPGIGEWLERGRARGYRQAIASSGDMANIVAVLVALDIVNYFSALVAGAFLPRSKPDPAIFLQAAASLGATPDESLVIEDGIVGVEAAKRAGMRCIGLTSTHPAGKLAGADLIVARMDTLDEDAFERLLGQKAK
jgi:HAD superfamily hydrolase (TIGR01509 family)